MILELVNPSDAVTFIGDDIKVAGVATLLLGRGQYGLEDCDGKMVVPLMLFGTHEEWFKENDINLDHFISEHAKAIAAFLDTCVYGDVDDRRVYEYMCRGMSDDEVAEYKSKWDDRKRSSMNNIGAAAHSIAMQLRTKYCEPVAAK
jgi:hypothetical protein